METTNKREILKDYDYVTLEQLYSNYDEIKHYLRVVARTKYSNLQSCDYEDILHDVIININNAINKGKSVNSAYIKKAIHTTILKRFRKIKNTRKFVYNDEDVNEMEIINEDNFDEILKEKLELESKYDSLNQSLDSLSETDRTLLNYSLVLGMTTIQDLSGLPYGMINNEVNRIRKTILHQITHKTNE